MTDPEILRTVFAQNRTEELGSDVWQHFVVPPFFDRLDLEKARKPQVIVGGRGCGKTMLLKYLSHQTTFSSARLSVPPDALGHIGLYWRADTQFAKVMTERGVTEAGWNDAFAHLTALTVGAELLESVIGAATANVLGTQPIDVREIHLDDLAVYDRQLTGGIADMLRHLRGRLREFASWVANVGKIPEPIFLPGRQFLLSLIDSCRNAIPRLKDAVFFVYLDEYENLLGYQQRIINTYLKHSEAPLIFNLAMKRNGFGTTQTMGEEAIVDIADYRTHDLEKYIDDGFELFAAEVLLLTLSLAKVDVPATPDLLRSRESLAARRDPQYREKVLGFVREMFPGYSHQELAQEIVSDDALRQRLRRRIAKALEAKGSDLSPDQFVRDTQASASVVSMALLYRRRVGPLDVLAELNRLEDGLPNKFAGPGDWTHNNLLGCVLSLYEASPRVCPAYAGFGTFVLMARGNLRHFLELCHQSLNERKGANEPPRIAVTPQQQAQAARYVSAAFLGQVRSFGRLGNQLHAFVLRLGSLFALAHQRPTQSEPEQSHFSITRGSRALTDGDHAFIREAVKWSVLFEEEETKAKDVHAVANFEYVLNPIYAPYFNITYRKIRRLELTVDEFQTLSVGTYDAVNSLLRRYSERWAVSLTEANPTLFSHLLEDN
jgi:hypothetical protein